MAEIKSVNDLLSMPLRVPEYQRPYKWGIRNIDDLLNDISQAINDSKTYENGFKYRIGTIVLHRRNGGLDFDIVDGQQRIVSLTLLGLCISPGFESSMLDCSFSSPISQSHIQDNIAHMKEWFSLKPNALKEAFNNAYKNILEVVVIEVDQVAEAFQLFDSQNTRGKALAPHDLLKAYHLREMRSDRYEMEHAVTKWEANDMAEIQGLFDWYLYPILNWAQKEKSKSFTAKDIDVYKGISEHSGYTYARRTCRAMPYFQITEPFIAGNDFFEMVDHYLRLLTDIQTEIAHNKSFQSMNEILNWKTGSIGFTYAKNLFYSALLHYYDRFHNFDEMAVKKLFVWAFMLRVDMKSLSFGSINKYAIGEDNNGRYTNNIPMFARIKSARIHKEISSLKVKIGAEGVGFADVDTSKGNWSELHEKLLIIMGAGDECYGSY